MVQCPHCNDLALRSNTPQSEVTPFCDIKASATRGCAGCSIIATGVELCCRPHRYPDLDKVPDSVRMDIPMFANDHAPSTISLGAHGGVVKWRGFGRYRHPNMHIEFLIPKGTTSKTKKAPI